MDTLVQTYREFYTGTGATLPIVFGFQPRLVKIMNKFGGLIAAYHTTDACTRLFHPYIDGLLDDPVPQIGSTPANVANLAFRYVIAGIPYQKAAVAAGTAPGSDTVPVNKYGAVAFDIASDGTLDAVSATGNATGYATAALALAGIASAGASHIRAFMVTAMNTGGSFVFGTTSLATTTATVAYYGGDGRKLTTTGVSLYGSTVGDTGLGISLGSSQYINKAGEVYLLEAYR